MAEKTSRKNIKLRAKNLYNVSDKAIFKSLKKSVDKGDKLYGDKAYNSARKAGRKASDSLERQWDKNLAKVEASRKQYEKNLAKVNKKIEEGKAMKRGYYKIK